MSLSSIYKPAFWAAVLSAALVLAASPAHADELKKSKKKQRAIQVQIKDQEEKLKRTVEAESNTLDALDNINKILHTKQLEIKGYQSQIRMTELKIRDVTADISKLNAKLDRHRQWMARKLRAMHRHGRHGDLILVLAASEDASDLMKRWHYLEELARYERETIEDYKNTIAELDAKEAELVSLRQSIASDRDRVRKSEEDLAKEKKYKQQILASVQKKREAYEQMLKDLHEASKNLQKMIEKEERKKRFASKGFRNLKGKLPWPVNGNVAISYGAQNDPKYNTPVFRNGIYIATPDGANAKAVHAGRVDYADWFKGYGQLVIVNHGGGYHSLYANLSEIFLKEGDIIEDRVDIGKVGDSSVVNKASLYFEIRYKGKPLDPEQWLKK
jgi:septal ring factor EnvC (AmiA/AmiB activator)